MNWLLAGAAVGAYLFRSQIASALGIGTTVAPTPPVNPSPNLAATNCPAGTTADTAGICTKYSDEVLLAQLNNIPWTNLTDIPAEQIARIDPAILTQYMAAYTVNAGTVLAYILGLGNNPAAGVTVTGSDGHTYVATGTEVFSRLNGIVRANQRDWNRRWSRVR